MAAFRFVALRFYGVDCGKSPILMWRKTHAT
jgi:hypothetical protein